MWSARDSKDGQFYHFLVGQQYSVGRKDTTIVIPNDHSISRCHAIFQVCYEMENEPDVPRRSILRIKDMASKCGTFVNGIHLPDYEDRDLVNEDIVQFGLLDRKFVIYYEHLVVCTSCIDKAKIPDLNNLISQLGGHLVDTWQCRCTHLVMPKVKFSIKAISCLAALRPIVSYEYFEDLVQCWVCRSTERRLEEKCYNPFTSQEQDDENTNIFSIRQERQTLFNKMTFYFFKEKQLKKFRFIIFSAGGKIDVIKNYETIDFEILAREGSCVIKPFDGPLSRKTIKLCNKVTEMLKNQKKRLVSQSDIGVAIIGCSVQYACNPNFHGKVPSVEMYETDARAAAARQFGNEYCNLNNPQPGTSKSDVIDCIDLEESDDGFTQETRASDDDVIVLPSPTGKEQPDTIPPGKTNRSGGSNLQIKTAKVIAIENDNDDLPPASELKKNSLLKEKNSLECQEADSCGLPTSENLNVPANLENRVDIAENEPSASMKFKFAFLIKRDVEGEATDSKDQDIVKNFKKFKKVTNSATGALPKIIGGRDLIPHDTCVLSSKPVKNKAKNRPQDTDVSKEQGEFDWDAPSD